jgi:hypothetical protein
MRTEEEGYWSAFKAFAEEHGISLLYKDDWEHWWICWNAALNAADDAYLSSRAGGISVDDDFDDIPF